MINETNTHVYVAPGAGDPYKLLASPDFGGGHPPFAFADGGRTSYSSAPGHQWFPGYTRSPGVPKSAALALWAEGKLVPDGWDRFRRVLSSRFNFIEHSPRNPTFYMVLGYVLSAQSAVHMVLCQRGVSGILTELELPPGHDWVAAPSGAKRNSS